MKKKLWIFLGWCFMSAALWAQGATKPKLMVVPSEAWCIERGYVMEFDNQGKKQEVADYQLALQTDIDLLSVIAKIGAIMIERGFPLVNLDAALRNAKRNETWSSSVISNSSGSLLAENSTDRLKKAANADILLELTWKINTTGPKKSVTYTLTGKDAYTNKEVAIAQGTGEPSFAAGIPVLLEEAVITKMDGFVDQLQRYFDDMVENGREVTVEVRVFDNGSGIDLETEYKGEELMNIIDSWMAEHTINHCYNFSSGSENYILFEQVRIPLFMTNGRPMDTRLFVNELRKFLAEDPYNLTCKVIPQGLGLAVLVIGEK